MLFVEFRFFIFFAVVFTVYWLLPSNRNRKIWLLGASYLFYGSWDYRFLLLLLASTLVDYLAALHIDKTDSKRQRNLVFWSAIAFNLSVLGLFKYYDFFSQSFADFLSLFGISPQLYILNVVLPLGISFYTFQTMSYTIDVYRRRIKATSSILNFALFVAFFPQLVAGPIVRAGTLLKQFAGLRSFPLDARAAILLCVVGYIKKAAIADNIAAVIDPVWANPLAYDWTSIVTAQVLFLVQIYCDFSGYSDIAVGTAALLGYELPRNFGPALLSRDLGEMWRLWHITLGTWFRDYVFAPLVKNRRDPGAIATGLLITMTLIGFWHGADWKFIVWGSLQGAAMAYLTLVRLRSRGEKKAKLPYFIALPLTFGFTTLASTFFRADDMRTAVGVLIADFSGSSGISSITIYPLLAFATLGLVHGGWHKYDLENRIVRIPGTWFAVGCGVALAVAFAFTPREIRPFVYFQF